MKQNAAAPGSRFVATLVRELPVLAFIAGVVFVFALFRLALGMLVASYEGPTALSIHLTPSLTTSS